MPTQVREHRHTKERALVITPASGHERLRAHLEENNKEENKQDTSGISSFIISTQVFPLKQGFGEKNTCQRSKTGHLGSELVHFVTERNDPYKKESGDRLCQLK